MQGWRRLGAFACVLTVAGAIAVACDSSSDAPPAVDAGKVSDATIDTGTDAPACAADIANDPANCGRCDRACGAGSTCAMGRCSPVALGQSAGPITALAVGLGSVFFAANGLHSCAKDGCAGGQATALNASKLAQFGLDTTTEPGTETLLFSVYGASGHVSRCDTGACTEVPITTTEPYASRIVAVKEAAYFASDFILAPEGGAPDAGDGGSADAALDGAANEAGASEAGAPPNGAVQRAPINGLGAVPTFVADAKHVLGFAFAGNTVAWTDAELGVSVCTHPCASATPAFAVGAGMMAAPAGRPVIAAGTLFWATVSGAVVSCALTNCLPTLAYVISPSADTFYGDLAADNTTLYLSVVTTTRTSAPAGSGGISTCSLASLPCTPVALVTGIDVPNHIAIDGDAAYFATGSGSTDGTIPANASSTLMRVTR